MTRPVSNEPGSMCSSEEPLACHFLFLSLCPPQTAGTGGIKEERGLKKRWEMKGDNDRLTDTTVRGH